MDVCVNNCILLLNVSLRKRTQNYIANYVFYVKYSFILSTNILQSLIYLEFMNNVNNFFGY